MVDKAKGKTPKKGRRTYAELFLDKLTELSDGKQQLIGNKTLREALKWEEDRYKSIHSELKSQRKIMVGQGHGGTVGLASAPGTKALKVFISYCHTDELYKDDLHKHLQPLQRLQLIDSWHDRKIKVGEEWEKKISLNLETADVILLLVSIDFINSEYCYDIEMDRAIERHDAGEAVVIPIILRSCMWKLAPFAKLQAAPKDARPIALWSDRDEALVSVAEAVRVAAEDRLSTS